MIIWLNLMCIKNVLNSVLVQVFISQSNRSQSLKMNMHKISKNETAFKYGHNQFIIILKL